MSKIFVDEIAGIASADTVAIPGHVIQVVQAVGNSRKSTASSSFVTTDLSVSITPTSSSSKIILMLLGGSMDCTVSGRQMFLTIFRNGSVNLGNSSVGITQNYNTGGRIQNNASIGVVDEPNTTSATTYAVYMRVDTSGNTVYFNVDDTVSTLVAMEIAG